MQIQENVALAPFTTLRIGGPARFFTRITDETGLWEALQFARDEGISAFVLGGGSNLVVPDDGYAGLVLHLALTPSILRTDTRDHILFDVSAGTDWNDLVRDLCEQGISGMECLAGIPGFVGGSPIQNIGAYGQEVSQTIAGVRALDRETGFFTDLSPEECRFAYRSSVFNTTARGRHVVTAVRFRLDRVATPNLAYADLKRYFDSAVKPSTPSPLEVYEAVREIRSSKGMLIDPADDSPDTRSAGSFFKNPIVPASLLATIAAAEGVGQEKIPHWGTPGAEIKLPAAWLIEQAGFPKGFVQGRVGISSRHTLALINRTGSATCADLLVLRDTIADEVHRRFQVRLEQEPIVLG